MPEFPPLKNDRLLKAAKGEEVDRIPVWAMRQAGRYLPEFREVRKGADFFTMCRTPELACKVTLQPLERFDLDAAIIFSDILVVPQAVGMHCEMVEGKGPVFPRPLKHPEDMKDLNFDVDVKKELKYVYDAITLTRQRLEGKCPLIGFAGGPWTLMAYMVEGGGSKLFADSKTWLYAHPEASHRLLDMLTTIIIKYLVEQIRAGAQALQVFESNAGELTPAMAQEFMYPYIERIAKEVKAHATAELGYDVPMVIFCRCAHYALPNLSQMDYDVIGLDFTVDPIEARKVVSPKGKSLQGNLDPGALFAPRDKIKTMTHRMLDSFGRKGTIANLGHGMMPSHNPEHLRAFVDAVHDWSG
eukprot:Clim_evm17s151 gene=Clim_evmTU17s151